MTAGDFQVRYNDFKGGHAGNVDPARWDRDQWAGVNVQVYRTGLLGPRAGLKQLTYTGLPNHPVDQSPAGFVFDPVSGMFALVLDRLYLLPPNGGAVTARPVYPGGVVVAQGVRAKFAVGNGVLYALLHGGVGAGTIGSLYRHDAGATVAIATPVTLENLVRWGQFMVGVSGPTNRHRIYFSQVTSAGADFNTWPANNFYDVGNTDRLTALEPIFNTLYAGKLGGWSAISGVLGDLASIREVAVGGGPTDPERSIVGWDNRIHYLGRELYPMTFDGAASPVSHELQRYDAGQVTGLVWGGRQLAATAPPRKVLMMVGDVLGSTLMLLQEGTRWSRLSFPTLIAGWAPHTVADRQAFGQFAGAWYCVNQAQAFGGNPVVVSRWRDDLDRPGHFTDAAANAVDLASPTLVTGDVSFPAYYEPNGRQVRVRRVIVQFRKWSSGVGGTTNRLRVRVDALGSFGDGSSSSAPQEWSQASTSGSTTGIDDSARFEFADQGYGNGFQVVVEALAGVAIREVIVEADTQRNR